VIHPQVVDAFEVGTSKMWHHDEFAGGAFALFDPGQQTLLHPHITAPEGRITSRASTPRSHMPGSRGHGVWAPGGRRDPPSRGRGIGPGRERANGPQRVHKAVLKGA